jgi:thymidylate synthase
MYITAATLDDLLLQVYQRLLSSSYKVRPTRGEMTELDGVLLKLRNPRARLSRTEMRGKLFSSLGELLWYLAGSNRLDFIEYYLRRYREESEDGKTIHGAYGPRLFNSKGQDQIRNVLDLLRSKPTSRRAVIQIFDAADLDRPRKEIPCTCTLQFLIRRGKLQMLVNMRSNDAFIGLPHDIFAFTMLQEIFARSLDVEVGSYKQAIGSLHLYDEHATDARQYVEEGFQSTVIMPPMPVGDPWPALNQIKLAESKIRKGKSIDASALPIHRYWQDIVRLLQIYALPPQERRKMIPKLKKMMSTPIYDVYIEKRKRGATKPTMLPTPVQEPLL